MAEEKKLSNRKEEKIEDKVENAQEKIVDNEVRKVEEGKETPRKAEKEIAEKTAKAEVKQVKEATKIKRHPKKHGEKKEAKVYAGNISMSTKHAIAICNHIRNRNIDKAIEDLENVSDLKKPIPMRGEIPHKKGIMSGRFPLKACSYFIRLLKSLKSNAIVNEIEIEESKIYCMANVASRPYRRFGRGRFKRTNVTLKLVPMKKK